MYLFNVSVIDCMNELYVLIYGYIRIPLHTGHPLCNVNVDCLTN